ncbi:hypothetical protein [Embleya sp. NPDC005971]|uniref:hypothetical protein n=1 Tax=Embleya sp. NPDC005971 TaxID=3156724 RepID=UPI0033C7A043
MRRPTWDVWIRDTEIGATKAAALEKWLNEHDRMDMRELCRIVAATLACDAALT